MLTINHAKLQASKNLNFSSDINQAWFLWAKSDKKVPCCNGQIHRIQLSMEPNTSDLKWNPVGIQTLELFALM